MIDANIFPVLIDILGKAEFKTRKEAAWVITNATSGGTPEQTRFLVSLVSGGRLIKRNENMIPYPHRTKNFQNYLDLTTFHQVLSSLSGVFLLVEGASC